MPVAALSPLTARLKRREAILAELAPLSCYPRADEPDHVCLAGLHRTENVFELTTWPCRLAFLSRDHGSFLLSAPERDPFTLFSRFTSQSIPHIAGLVVTPLAGVDLEFGCHAIVWAIEKWRTAKGVGGRGGGGGGPGGVRR